MTRFRLRLSIAGVTDAQPGLASAPYGTVSGSWGACSDNPVTRNEDPHVVLTRACPSDHRPIAQCWVLENASSLTDGDKPTRHGEAGTRTAALA